MWCSYFFDVFGLRWASLTAAFLVFVGCAVRLLALTHGSNDADWVSASGGGPGETCATLFAHPERAAPHCAAKDSGAATACPIVCADGAHGAVLLWMHLGQFLNGLAGPVGMMSGPVLSAAWFPPSSRVLILNNYVLTLIGFLLHF